MEVGSQLYELDTEATGFTVEATATDTEDTTPSTSSSSTAEPAAAAAAAVETPVAAAAASSSSSSSSTDHRTPSIHFLGKDGWEARKSGTTTTAAVSTNPLAVTAIADDAAVRHPMYGRPVFTDEEMEALLAGGATIAPEVAHYSSGAKFLTMVQQQAQ